MDKEKKIYTFKEINLNDSRSTNLQSSIIFNCTLNNAPKLGDVFSLKKEKTFYYFKVILINYNEEQNNVNFSIEDYGYYDLLLKEESLITIINIIKNNDLVKVTSEGKLNELEQESCYC